MTEASVHPLTSSVFMPEPKVSIDYLSLWDQHAAPDATARALHCSARSRAMLHRLANVAVREELSDGALVQVSTAAPVVQSFWRQQRCRRLQKGQPEFYVHLSGQLVLGTPVLPPPNTRLSMRRIPRVRALQHEEQWQHTRLKERQDEADGHVSLKLWLYCVGDPRQTFGEVLRRPHDFHQPQRGYMRGQYLCFVARDTLIAFVETQVHGYQPHLVDIDYMYGFSATESGWHTNVPFVLSFVNVLRDRLHADILRNILERAPPGAYFALPGVLEFAHSGTRLLRSMPPHVTPDEMATAFSPAGLLRHASPISEHLTRPEIRRLDKCARYDMLDSTPM